MSDRIGRVPHELRRRVAQEAGYRCGYCRTPEAIAGVRLTIEHIIPQARGGQTVLDNVWLACHACNEFKGSRVRGRDSETGKHVRLWHPRRQKWLDHFLWSDDGAVIIGITSCGRATVSALQLNRAELVAARSLWVSAGGRPKKIRNSRFHAR